MAIALGCAWTDELLEHDDIVASLDFIEVAGWLLHDEFVRPHERIILHNLDQNWSMATVDAIDQEWTRRLHQAIQLTRTPWFSMHLGFASERVRFDDHMLPESEPLERTELLARIVAVTNEARLDCPLQVLLENLDYCPEGAYEHICEPAFIAEVIEMTGAGVLFDTAHWRVSGSWLGYDPIEALNEVPLDRIVEIHLSSPRPLGDRTGRLDDCHESLEQFDYELLRVLLDRANPRAITLEYQRDMDELRLQIANLREILNGHDDQDARG